jgi:isocitrate lyase
VPTVICARTDAGSAKLITSDVDERDHEFLTGERTAEGFFRLKDGTGVDHCIKRGLALRQPCRPAVVGDVEAQSGRCPPLRRGDQASEHPDKMLAYNCSPSFNWRRISTTRRHRPLPARAGRDGLQVPVRHARRLPPAQLRHVRAGARLRDRGMAAYSELQQAEFAAEANGYTATRHQREVGTGYFDAIAQAVAGGESSTTALAESTEAAQFNKQAA